MGTLLETWDGRRFECLVTAEAEFLYEEIVTRRSYLQEDVQLPDGSDTDVVVVDVGANIGRASGRAERHGRHDGVP